MKANVMFLLALFGLMLVAQAKPIDMEKRGKVGDIVQALFDGLKTGKATWFHPVTEGGPEGACDGIKEDDDSSIVALSLDLFGDEDAVSDFCKKKVWIKNKKNGKTVKATITDACPGCKKSMHTSTLSKYYSPSTHYMTHSQSTI